MKNLVLDKQTNMITIIQALEISSIVLVGILTGASLYSSMVEIPIRAKTSEEEQLKNWRLVFPKASKLLIIIGNIAMVLVLITWYLTGNMGWLMGAIPLIILIPFTVIFIFKTNAELTSLTDLTEVSTLIKNWGKLHNVRTILSIISFIICAISVVLGVGS